MLTLKLVQPIYEETYFGPYAQVLQSAKQKYLQSIFEKDSRIVVEKTSCFPAIRGDVGNNFWIGLHQNLIEQTSKHAFY